MLSRIGVALIASAFALAGSASASTLSMSPVMVEIRQPAKTSKITLRNRGEDAIAAQIRVFRWVNKDGTDQLIPTKEVVASPPAAKLLPNTEYKVRLVRVAKTPVVGEESYRLLIDQLPKPASHEGARVAFTVRHSIPVFFQGEGVKSGPLLWSASIRDRTLVLTAANQGSRRARLFDVKVKIGTREVDARGGGLAGYVLGRSAAQWSIPLPKGLKTGSTITITARDERGPLKATAKVGSAP